MRAVARNISIGVGRLLGLDRIDAYISGRWSATFFSRRHIVYSPASVNDVHTTVWQFTKEKLLGDVASSRQSGRPIRGLLVVSCSVRSREKPRCTNLPRSRTVVASRQWSSSGRLVILRSCQCSLYKQASICRWHLFFQQVCTCIYALVVTRPASDSL